MWVVGGLQVRGVFSRKQVYRGVVEARSDYKKPYWWGFRNIACGDSTGRNWTKFMYLLDLVGKIGEKGWCDLVCVDCL